MFRRGGLADARGKGATGVGQVVAHHGRAEQGVRHLDEEVGMPWWWAWVLLAWGLAAVGGALWIGAAAAGARRREHAARVHRLAEDLDQEWRDVG